MALLLAPPLLAAPQIIPMPVTANQVDRGEMLVSIDNDEVAMRVSDLESLGISGTGWNRLLMLSRTLRAPLSIQGAEAISLETLEPYVKYVMNQENLSLELTVTPSLLALTSIAARPSRPADIIYTHDRTGFFNYSVSAANLKDIAGFGEAGLAMSRGLFYSGFSRPANGQVIRGMSNFTFDDRKRLNRWTLGDAVVSPSDPLGGSAILTGLTIARNFNLDPYFIRFPTMNLAGMALTPSRVDVYVNGVLVSEQEVPPGPFDLRGIQVTPGSGSTRLVVRDAFGREQVQTADYYYSTNVLEHGLSEFIYSAGVEREQFGIRSFDYGDPAALAFHRYGFTEWLTGGGRAEASRGLWSAGPTASVRTGIGDFGVSGSFSGDHGSTGAAGALSYLYLNRRFGFGGQFQTMSREYATLSLRKESDRALTQATAFASVSGRRGSLSAQYSHNAMRDTESFTRETLLASISVARGTSLIVSAGSVDQGGVRHGEFFAGASFSLGSSSTASAGFSRQGGQHQSTFEVDRPVPVGTGMGYRIASAFSGDGTHTGAASLSYQTPFGRYDLTGDPFQSGSRPSLSAAGGLVLAGGTLKLSPPVQDSYALVRVPGVDGVRVFASNQLVGRTDPRGNLLIPSLLSYYGNPLRIEDKDVPMTYQVDGVEKTIAPPYRGGAVVVFPVREHRSVTGKVGVSSGNREISPALGTFTLTKEAKEWESPLGRTGDFDFEDIPEGTYDALLEYRDGTCRFRVKVPPGGSVDLGRVVCTQVK